MDSIVLTGYQLGIGGITLTIAGFAFGGTLSGFSLLPTLLLGYLVILSSASLGFWTVLLKYNRVGLVTVFYFMVPVFGVVLSAIFLGESIFEWKNVVALILVCGGIWLATREQNR